LLTIKCNILHSNHNLKTIESTAYTYRRDSWSTTHEH